VKIARLRLRNFRCYKNEIKFDFGDLTAFVGKNDAGKSSIMDALDIFLNDGVPDKNDASKDGEAKDLTIICEFTDCRRERLSMRISQLLSQRSIYSIRMGDWKSIEPIAVIRQPRSVQASVHSRSIQPRKASPICSN
jgi:predicted ATP-dependent endonuclease of OLD family